MHAKGNSSLPVRQIFAFEQAASAHRHSETRHGLGKLVVAIDWLPENHRPERATTRRVQPSPRLVGHPDPVSTTGEALIEIKPRACPTRTFSVTDGHLPGCRPICPFVHEVTGDQGDRANRHAARDAVAAVIARPANDHNREVPRCRLRAIGAEVAAVGDGPAIGPGPGTW
ncbi:hypothetical protein I4J89_44175 [Actinoplanes sp. NEAU-A11]|uniref:Uncharacterized protein n=1 Tax=Actinoplanes aureus TaxID=2792083 RepID=A0A931CGY9_9ACTN|nr:hypothetical protein [Actinoplanes aureus]